MINVKKLCRAVSLMLCIALLATGCAQSPLPVLSEQEISSVTSDVSEEHNEQIAQYGIGCQVIID